MAQSLIEQLQLGAIDGASPITDLLRRAKLAAVKLGATDFAAWADLEMIGYAGQTSVPEYRQLRGALFYKSQMNGWQPILGMDNLEKGIVQPIGEIAELAKERSGILSTGVPDSFRRKMNDQIGYPCDMQLRIPSISVFGVVEAVRNKVLNWTLKLEAAGVHGHGLSFTSEEAKAAQGMTVTNNYHAPVASIVHGNATIGNVSQTNTPSTPQDIAEAVAKLIEVMHDMEATPSTARALSDLGDAENDLRQDRVPFGRISASLDVLSKASDMALKVPEVAGCLHQLMAMCGFTSL